MERTRILRLRTERCCRFIMICVMVMATAYTDNIINTKTDFIIGDVMMEAGHSGNQYQ